MKKLILVTIIFICCINSKAQDSTNVKEDSCLICGGFSIMDSSFFHPKTFSLSFSDGKKYYEIIFEYKDIDKIAKRLSKLLNMNGIKNKLKID